MKKTILLMFFGAAIFFGCQKEDMNSDSANANVQKVYQLNTQSEVPFWEEVTLNTENSFSEHNVQYKNANVTHMHGNFTGFGGSVSVTFNGTVNNSGAQGQAEFTQVLGGPFGTANFIMETECITRDGNNAAYTGIITNVISNGGFPGGGPFALGNHFTFYVKDNGQGANAPMDQYGFSISSSPNSPCGNLSATAVGYGNVGASDVIVVN